MKICIANTPLILTDASGNEYRVEAGATVSLTAEQYESVAAHVALQSEPEAAPDGETPSEDTPSDDAGNTTVVEVEKPKRGKKPAAAEEAE